MPSLSESLLQLLDLLDLFLLFDPFLSLPGDVLQLLDLPLSVHGVLLQYDTGSLLALVIRLDERKLGEALLRLIEGDLVLDLDLDLEEDELDDDELDLEYSYRFLYFLFPDD